jgi:hypothetical protein
MNDMQEKEFNQVQRRRRLESRRLNGILPDRAMYGSDQTASLEPVDLRSLVGAVRKIEKRMSDGVIKILDNEVPINTKLRSHFRYE